MFQDRPFELNLAKTGGVTICMIGAGRSGKTYALGHILETYFKKHIGVLYTGSPQIKEYEEMDLLQSPQFLPKVIKTMYDIQKETSNHYRFLNVLDDIADKKFDKTLMNCMTHYRNSDMSLIQCVQDVNLLNASGRNNFNIVMLFKLNTDDRVERAIKAYLKSWFPPGMKMIDMIREYKKLTEDHHFLVLDSLNGEVYRSKIIKSA